MERVPDDGDSKAERRANGVLKQLCRALQLLASPAQAQLSHFPAHSVVLTDEMALDFDHWVQSVPTYWTLSKVQAAKLTALDDFLNKMSGPLHEAFWTDEALFSDPRWEEIRKLAESALVSFGWPIQVPPPAQYQDGMVVDGEYTFYIGDFFR